MEVRALFCRFVWRGVNIDDVTIHPSRGSRINPTLKVCEHNRVAHASMAPNNRLLLGELGWITCVAWKSNKKKRRDEDTQKTKAQRTEAQSSMTCSLSDLAGLLISIGKIVQREESGQSKDFEEGKWCSSHASATATCEQSRPKQGEGKDQASDTYKWLPCIWK